MSEQLFDLEDFSRRLRVRMAERGIDQKTCAEEASVSKSSLSRICGLTLKPNVENYLRLSAWMSEAATISHLQAEIDRLREALKAILQADTYVLHVGYDHGGAFLYADAIRTDDPAFRRARAALGGSND